MDEKLCFLFRAVRGYAFFVPWCQELLRGGFGYGRQRQGEPEG
jgi:hypothetical protein